MRSKLATTKNGAAASDVGTTGPCLRRFATPVDSLSAIGSFGLRIFVECHFGGFPLAVIYRDIGDTIQVLAVAHHRREPGYWVRRT